MGYLASIMGYFMVEWPFFWAIVFPGVPQGSLSSRGVGNTTRLVEDFD